MDGDCIALDSIHTLYTIRFMVSDVISSARGHLKQDSPKDN